MDAKETIDEKYIFCKLIKPVFTSNQGRSNLCRIFSTINERLSYMEDVALFKAQNHLPIEDIQRESVVINKAKVSASEQGLDPEIVKDFFQAQISVAKAIQYRYRADLLSQPPS